MSVGIECPVCEAVFTVKRASQKTGIRCPECKRKFRYSEAVLADKKPAKVVQEKPAQEPTSEKKPPTESKPAAGDIDTATNQASTEKPDRARKKSKWKTTATEAPRLQTPKPIHNSDLKQTSSASSLVLDPPSTDATPSDIAKLEHGQDEPPKLSQIQDRKKQKTRRQTRNAILAIVTLSIVTAVLGFLLYRQLNLPANQLAGDSGSAEADQAPINAATQNSSPSDPEQITPGDQPAAESDEPDEDEQAIEAPRVLADDLPNRKFEYLKKSELQSVWKRVRPRLISLTIRTDLGVEQSVGTIIDSRGWVLTSNQLVNKWPDVSATASARNIDAYYADLDTRKPTNDSPARQTLLTDLSKGIASALPKRDQTLLAVNTRFVVSLDKFEFAARNNLVAGMYLVQAAPPSPTNPYGFEEVKVHGRQEFEELETAAVDKAKALGIDDPLTTWLVTTKKAAPLVGTPVFTRNSKMVGTYAFSTKQFAYFILSDQAPKLIAQAAQSGAEKGKLQQVKVSIPLLSPSHSMARPSELLNRAGVACEAFGWIPADADQYKQLQKFSRRFSTVAKFIQDNQDDASDSGSLSILSDQIKRWQRSLSESIRNSYTQTPEKINELNAFAIDKLTAPRPNTANTYIPFVAEFYQRGRDENDRDAILITLNEDQTVVKLPFSGRIREMRPGSLWLCFYKRPSELKRLLVTLGSGQVTPLYDGGNILTVLGPIEKR